MRLRFATGRIGCLLPLIGVSAPFFVIGAVSPGFFDPRGRYPYLVELANETQFGGVAILWLIPALAMLWGFVRFGWRWADEIAVTATGDGLRFHPTVRRRSVPWSEVRDIRCRTRRQGLAEVREIEFVLGSGTVRIVGFEAESAEAFVRHVRDRLSLRP